MYSSLDMGMFLNLEATFSSLSKRNSTKVLHKLGSNDNVGILIIPALSLIGSLVQNRILM